MKTISWLMLFRKIITVCSENHNKRVNANGQSATLLNVKAGGTHGYHSTLEG
jgi:hypothetical protein